MASSSILQGEIGAVGWTCDGVRQAPYTSAESHAQTYLHQCHWTLIDTDRALSLLTQLFSVASSLEELFGELIKLLSCQVW